ncbi:unnamed protein product, partial [Nesidiocoris tenuis]
MLGAQKVVLLRLIREEFRLNGINVFIPIYVARSYPTSAPPADEKEQSKKKTVKCLGEAPPRGTKCPKIPELPCPPQEKLKVPPLPSECQSSDTGPVYDKMCQRPYRNPCYEDTQKPCKCDMIPQRCVAPCARKKRSICYGEPECAQESTIDWGLRIRQILLGIGTLIGGLILYRIHGSDSKPMILTMKKDRKFKRPLEVIKIPETSELIPEEIDFLLIGAGTAAYAAQKAIRSSVQDAKILMVSNGPPFIPAMRPPLSTQLWTEPDRDTALDLEFVGSDGKVHSLFFEPSTYYTPVQELDNPKGGVAVAQGWSIVKLDPLKRKATLDDGKEITYGKCLLATGGRPRVLPPFDEADAKVLEKITFYRNTFDFQELEEIIQHENVKCLAVVGGGLLGTEMVAALRERTKNQNIKIVNIVKDHGNMSRLLPTYMSVVVTKILAKRGIHIIRDAQVEDVTREGDLIKLYTNNDKIVTVDHVVVATGIEPNVDLAENSCIEVDPIHGGFAVNSEMMSCTDLYAAGDSASFYDCNLGRRREEHHSFAVATGQVAGDNMTGQSKRLEMQPSFGCWLAPDYVFEGTGKVDTSNPTVAIFPNAGEGSSEWEIEEESKTGNGSNGENQTAASPNGEHKQAAAPQDVSKKTNINHDHVRVESEVAEDEAKLSHANFRKGVIFYLNSNQEIVGILTINLPGKISIGKIIVNSKKKYDDIDELVKLFALHEELEVKKVK